MTDLSTHAYPHVYSGLGIDINKLGVVMVDTDPIPISELVTKPEPDLYTSVNPDHFWVRGAVGETGAHMTVLYGLMQSGVTWKPYIDEVLRDWTLDSIEIEKIGVFENRLPGEDYVCLVGLIKRTPQVMEGHQRLSFLPHINTFANYRPHVTLAYIKTEAKGRWLRELGNSLLGTKLAVKPGLNYGGIPA